MAFKAIGFCFERCLLLGLSARHGFDMKRISKCLSLWLVCLPSAYAQGLLGVAQPAENGEALQAYASVHAFIASDQSAVNTLRAGDLSQGAPRGASNISMLYAVGEAGLQWQGYRFGSLRRGEVFLDASRDTVDLVRQYATQDGYDPNRTYAMQYRMAGFEADGIKFSKSQALPVGDSWRLNAGVGVSYLRGLRLKLESLDGQAVTLNAKDFDATLNQSSSNTGLDTTNVAEFNAPFGQQARFSGHGFAVDAGMVLRHPATGTRIELAVADLYGRMDWTDVPTNVTAITTATKFYDANGYVQYSPTGTRTSSYVSMAIVLDPKVHMAIAYPWRAVELQGGVDVVRGYWLPQLGIAYAFGKGWRLTTDLDLRFQSVGVGIENTVLSFKVRTDQVNLNQAKAYGLSVRLSLPF